MNTTIQSVHLDQLQSIEEFTSVLESAAASKVDMLLLLRDQRMVGTIISLLATKEMLARMVAERWAENPDIIFELEKRLRTENPEDWDDTGLPS